MHFSSNVSVTQEINGDLFALGGKVNIQAPVRGGLNVAGGTVTVVSAVGNDARTISSRSSSPYRSLP